MTASGEGAAESAARSPWRCGALLFIAVFAAYGNSLSNGLVGFDDSATWGIGPTAPGGPRLLTAWRDGFAADPLSALPRFFLQRQMRNLSLAADRAMFGEDLWGPHLLNILYHWAASWLACGVAGALLGSPLGGLVAALLFALHPLQTESVANLGGRRDVLSAVFFLGSFLFWLSAHDRDRRALRLTLAVALWMLALGTKQVAVVMPALWVAHAWLMRPGNFGAWARRHAILIGGAALFVCAIVWIHVAQARWAAAELQLPAEALWYGGTFGRQWALQPKLLLHAVTLVLWPATLSGDYSYRAFDPPQALSEWEIVLAAALLAGSAAGAWRLRKPSPLGAFAAAWAVLLYMPTLPVLPTAHNLEVFAEHWLYLPLLGAAMLASAVFLQARARYPRASAAALALVLAACLGRTMVRNGDWRDSLTYWSKTAQSQPQCARALAGLGLAHFDKGRIDDAERLYRKAIELSPDYPQPRINMASLLLARGKTKEAEESLREILRLPLGRGALSGPVQHNLGVIFLEAGRIQAAYDAFKIAVEAGMGSLSQHGVIRAWLRLNPPKEERGQLEEMFRRILRKDPGHLGTLNDFGLLCINEGRAAEAVPLLERALAQAPDFVNARINLGLALTSLGRYPEAHVHLRRAASLAPDSSEAWIALAQLNRLWGKRPQALAAARKAVALQGSRRAYKELLAIRRSTSSK